jgi:hypothetical protein
MRTLHARAIKLVVARLAREARVASDANFWKENFYTCIVVSSIESEELLQTLKVVHNGGARGTHMSFSRLIPHAHAARCLAYCLLVCTCKHSVTTSTHERESVVYWYSI